tara:strand:+ start:1732 stop:3561 length:1830 start_codon:yes stop_codon:yes gene_type:complete
LKIRNNDSSKHLDRIFSSELEILGSTLTPDDLDLPEGWDKKLPDLPTDILEWIEKARPVVDGQPRDISLLPFWKDIYNDNHWNITITAGRQVFKSTYCTDVLAHEATTKESTQVVYVVDDENRLQGFSQQRFRIGTLSDNELLKEFPRNGLGAIGEVSMKNGSTVYLSTDIGGFRKVEGKSPSLIVLDEAQYQELEFMDKLESAMTMTRGKIKILGIGGELGSAYEKLWNRTDQREWIYDDPYWRESLQFDDKGLVIGDYMRDILKGRWKSTNPKSHFRGYHIPQTIMPFIPLTVDDAVNKYKTAASFALDYKKKNYAQSIYTTHVMGEFHRAKRRPITREMMLECMDPYKTMKLLTPEEVRALKTEHGEKITVTMGIDWGSGPSASKTVVAIIIHWVKPNIFQLAHVEPRPREDQFDQARYMVNMFESYDCDIGVADLGYGVHQVKTMQDGGADKKTGELFAGLGRDKLLGSRSTSNLTKPFQIHTGVQDEHGDETSRITIDKSAAIQELIDIIERKNEHPEYCGISKGLRPQLIIPFKNEYETEWLIGDFMAITRKDLAEIDDVPVVDKRNIARMEFNHPRDSMMAVIYAIQASDRFNGSKWNWVSA